MRVFLDLCIIHNNIILCVLARACKCNPFSPRPRTQLRHTRDQRYLHATTTNHRDIENRIYAHAIYMEFMASAN